MAIFQNAAAQAQALAHAPRPACTICGCTNIRLDYFDGDVPLELGECPRCSHRWTTSLLAPAHASGPPHTRARASTLAAARLLADERRLPHAA